MSENSKIHMPVATTDELLAMADKIGVARRWLQKRGTHQEHFDIAKGKRALAVQLGAIEIDRARPVEILRKRRCVRAANTATIAAECAANNEGA